MTVSPSNLILIGMPGAGKSTVGIVLAKLTSRDFVDTDVLIQSSQKRTLQKIIDVDGYIALRQIEQDVLVRLDVRNCVIATGGSAVYSHSAMAHLKTSGLVIFLDADIRTLESRIRNFSSRGLAKRADQSFDDLFKERAILYRYYADITVACAGLTHEEVCTSIMAQAGELTLHPGSAPRG
ncbi:MAG TPA: shikimate kinase [Desulfuromonadales bacterium]|nr:shikimate kinase [Desulfuromonadales bacterium]